MKHAFKIGELLYIKHWDETGAPMIEEPPALVIDRYVAVPQILPNDELTNELFVGSTQQLVYDVLLAGELEVSICENWLLAITDPTGKVK